MNEEELSAAVTELQATNKSLQSQHTEIFKTSHLIRLQMEEMTLALRSLAQQMGATTSVLDGLAGGSELRNSDLVLVGRRSEGSQQASSDPSVQTQQAILLVPLKRLEDDDEVAGVEDEDDDVEGDCDIGELEVIKPETTNKRSWSTVGFKLPQIRRASIGSIEILCKSDLSQIRGEQTTGSFMALNEYERRTNIAVMASFQPVAKLGVLEKPPPWPPPSRLLSERWQGRRVTTRTEAPTTHEAQDGVGLEPAMLVHVEASLFFNRTVRQRQPGAQHGVWSRGRGRHRDWVATVVSNSTGGSGVFRWLCFVVGSGIRLDVATMMILAVFEK